MDSRQRVVWISTGIVVLQGTSLDFDLLNCTAIGWRYVRINGLPAQAQQIDAARVRDPAGLQVSRQPSAGSTAKNLSTDCCSCSHERIDAARVQVVD